MSKSINDLVPIGNDINNPYHPLWIADMREEKMYYYRQYIKDSSIYITFQNDQPKTLIKTFTFIELDKLLIKNGLSPYLCKKRAKRARLDDGQP